MTRYCVLYNPIAGRRCNQQRLATLPQRLNGHVELRPTTGPHSATAQAREAVAEGFDVIVAAGGDGTVHEVACGILEADRRDVTLLVYPVGSANDYAHSLLVEHGEAARWPHPARLVDVGRVTGLREQEAWFLNSIGLGFSAMVTIESRAIRRLRGTLLYGVATLRAMWKHFAWQPWEVSIDDAPAEPCAALMLSVMNGRREGNFVLAPAAQLSDGRFEYVLAGKLSRWDIIRLLPSLAGRGPPANYPGVSTGPCQRLTVRSPQPIAAHVDGEILARPADVRFSATIELVSHRLQASVLEE
ncbi:MAG: diacylglycerol kinase family protein [Pirellulales bacterium]